MESTNKIIRLSVVLAFACSSAAMGQTTADAKKAIDAELYQKAIGSLKQLTAAQPAVGENYFLLGEAYLKNDYPDSAKATFEKGTAADPKYSLNYVGLGAVQLEANNAAGAKSNFDLALTKATGKKDNQPNLYIGKAYTEASVPDYKAAVPYLEAAIATNPKDAEAYLAVGNAHRGLGDNSAAYSDYTKALEMDKTLTRAKLELAVSVKMAKAFKEATEQLTALTVSDPNYGPAYRELAESYYQWFNNTNDPKLADENIKLALAAYEKYLEHTDRSVEKRLKRADYLLLSKDYKGLEAEANEMAKMDKANLRTLRYLGYSAFENGNYPATVSSLKDFIAKAEAKRIIARDYIYLAKGQLKTGDVPGAVASFTQAIKMDSTVSDNISPLAKEFFSAAKYDQAALLYELAASNPKSKSTVTDHFYLGYSYFFAYRDKYKADTTTSKEILVKADSAFSYVIQKSPTTVAPYMFRARISRLIDEAAALKGAMMPYYEKYVEVVETKGVATATAGEKKDLLEAYNNLGAFYAPTDPAKAKTLWEKTIAIDPANDYATKSLAQLAAMSGAAPTPK